MPQDDVTKTRDYLTAYAVDDPSIEVALNGAAFLTRAAFPAFDEPTQSSPFTKIAVNTGLNSWYKRNSDSTCVEGPWRRKSVAITLAGEDGHTVSSDVLMTGLAVNLDAITPYGETPIRQEALEQAANHLPVDPYSAFLLETLFQSSKRYGSSAAFIEQRVHELLRHLLRPQERTVHQHTPPLDTRRLSRVKAFIAEHAYEDLSVSDLARIAVMDTSYFIKSFQAATGMTPFVYLTRARMAEAKRLLLQNHSVTRVALSVGYSNPSKFAATFKRCYGMTPTGWLSSTLS
ncbi:MAG: AraC family transcriptional regulator [Pseudomonadota bacterium]